MEPTKSLMTPLVQQMIAEGACLGNLCSRCGGEGISRDQEDGPSAPRITQKCPNCKGRGIIG